MYQFVLVIHILAAICLMALVLVQQGKGAAMGAAFGSGASQTVFGSRGAGSFFLKVTGAFVIIFFATSITLNRMAVEAVKHNQTELPITLPDNAAPPVTPGSIPMPGSVEQPVLDVKPKNKKL